MRRKINVLPDIMNLFTETTVIEEDFEKNRIKCALAVGNTNTTLGFVVNGKTKPMTLLKENELNPSKEKSLDLVLRRKTGESKFTKMIIGNDEMLKEYKNSLDDVLAENLLDLVKES